MSQSAPFEVPIIVNGQPVRCHRVGLLHVLTPRRHQVKTGKTGSQINPSAHSSVLCTFQEADEATVASAIDGALKAKAEWEAMAWHDRASIFLKAADLCAGKYRFKLMAATMLGQGKNAWQAEIDAAAEVFVSSCDNMYSEAEILPVMIAR